MSKVNKYRAWNTEKKIMCYDNEDLSACYWGGVYSSEVGIINEYLNLPEHVRDYEYMQYTGVTDKNGKEIYEGDIVRNQQGEVYKVEYYISMCRFVLVTNTGSTWEGIETDYYTSVCSEIEVIGNVYENTDLLKE